VIFNNLMFMLFATASMERNSTDAKPPTPLRAPWQKPALLGTKREMVQILTKREIFPHSVLHHAGPSLALQAPTQWASVDMLVLPEAEPPANAAFQASNERDAKVKVTYTSAEDMADMLFAQTPSEVVEIQKRLNSLDLHKQQLDVGLMNYRSTLEALRFHGDQVHDGLLQHERKLDAFSAHRGDVHDGLLNHKSEIQSLNAHRGDVHDGLLDHKSEIQSLSAHRGQVHDGLLDHKRVIQSLSAHGEQVSEALLNHKDTLLNQRGEIADAQDILERVQDNFGEVDTGLKEHRLHITKLARKSGEVDEKLEEIASDIETLRRQLSSSTTASKATLAQKDLLRLQQQIDKLNQDSAKFDQGLRSHTRILEAQSSLSATSSKTTLAQKDLLRLQEQIDKLNRDSGKFDQGLRSHTRILEAQNTTNSVTQDHVSRLSQSVQKSLLDTHAQLQDVQLRHLKDSAPKTVDILQFAAPRRKGGQ
jgi:chromosome segregation ATPase